jgi:hypothetical protein
MLQAMQQTDTPSPSSTAASFAGFLAKLTISEASEQQTGVPGDGFLPPGSRPAPAWNDDELADDVATLSYEQALRTDARYTATDPADFTVAQSLAKEAAPEPLAGASGSAVAVAAPDSNLHRGAHFERNLKAASITIRMSQAECEQLRRRAAEAGLTVSAYLRSCTFEVESLRALVKETMAQLRSAQSAAETANSLPERRPRLGGLTGRFARLMPFRHSSQEAVRVRSLTAC